MADDGYEYGVNLQVCIDCACIVLVAAPTGKRNGAVDISSCPAVDSKFYACQGKMVPIESTAIVSEILADMQTGLVKLGGLTKP